MPSPPVSQPTAVTRWFPRSAGERVDRGTRARNTSAEHQRPISGETLCIIEYVGHEPVHDTRNRRA